MMKSLLCAVGIMVFSVSWVSAITCEECQKNQENIAQIKKDISNLNQEIEQKFQKYLYEETNALSKKVTEKTKEMIELINKEQQCRDACTPESVKQEQIETVVKQIKELQSPESEENQAKIDQKYKELDRYSDELRRLKEANAKTNGSK